MERCGLALTPVCGIIRRDKVSGEPLCAEHARRGEVTHTAAGALVSKALGRGTPLLPGKWSLWNSLGAEHGRLGKLTDVEKAAVRKACDAELERRCTEPPGNLTKCHHALNGMLPAAALEMRAPPARWSPSERPLGGSSPRRFRATGGGLSERQSAISTRRRSCPRWP